RTKAQSPDKIHISFALESERGSKNQHGSAYALSELQGLSSLQPDGPVSFSLVRDAGTIEASGTFSGGKGSGTFSFIPNNGFVDAMRSRGFDFAAESNGKGSQSTMEERLFVAATLNVTIALADDLRS